MTMRMIATAFILGSPSSLASKSEVNDRWRRMLSAVDPTLHLQFAMAKSAWYGRRSIFYDVIVDGDQWWLLRWPADVFVVRDGVAVAILGGGLISIMIEFFSTFFQNLVHWISQWDIYTLIFLAFLAVFAIPSYARVCFVKYGSNTLPGPPGLPLFGNLLCLHPQLHSYFTSLSKIYGPIFSLRLGAKHIIVLSSPSLARQVLKDHDLTFANRSVTVAGRVAFYDGSDILWTPYGPEWRMLKKVFVQWIVSNCATDSLCALRRKEVQKTVGYLYSRVGSPVDIGQQMYLTVLNIITNMIWGGTAAEEDDEMMMKGAEFRKVVARIVALLGKPNISDIFPWLALFDLQGVEQQMRLAVQQFDQIFEKVIKQRLKKKEEEYSKDFLGFLLKLKGEHDSKTPLTITQVKALLMDMLAGGTDTTVNTMEFAMAQILNNPKVMKGIQEELETVVGRENMVQESHIGKLPYLFAVMKETLRLYPVGALLVPHCPSQATNVEGYKIPRSSRVFVNVWAIHRDASVWDNPLCFDPTRFLDAKCDYRGNDFNYLPFGSGRRICAGIALAERNFMYLMATLIHLFDWRVPEDQKLDVSEKFGILLKKKTPLVVIPTPRLSNSALYL
ncbi:geraniol 8-hydroxylase-like [Neltuma alba]|uniref:geraniol 8-hydroxylase-like n=1 Tax=Neltuma alba TaxID=207710 RepID=UPI0010A557DA|nr:geraniol 8-hydroxylase-like [Prosopis alba]